MLIYIITVAVLSLCAYVFKIYWKSILKAVYYILKATVDVVAKAIVSVKRNGKAIFWLYKRWKNGNYTKQLVKTEEEEVDVDLLEPDLRDALNTGNEVINRTDDIDPTEWEKLS